MHIISDINLKGLQGDAHNAGLCYIFEFPEIVVYSRGKYLKKNK